MGCASSSQTSAVDPTRPSSKPEESNGASTTGVASENGNIAEDSETIPDQTPVEGSDAKPDSEPDAAAAAATSGDGNDASPLAGADSQPSADITPVQAPAETPAAETPETATSSSEAAAPEQATDSETKAEEAPAPSE